MIFKVFIELYEHAIRNIGGSMGRKLRYWHYKGRLGSCGKNVIIDIGVIIKNPRSVFIKDNVWIDDYVMIIAGAIKNERVHRKAVREYVFKEGELHIESGVHIGPLSVVQAHGGVYIGQDVGIASGCKIYSMSGYYKNLNDPADTTVYSLSAVASSEKQFSLAGAIVLMHNCAIGLNSILLPGSVIGENTWVGVNTYVNGKKLRSNSIYGTEQAKRIHTFRNDNNEELS